jgi:hypothetical protein
MMIRNTALALLFAVTASSAFVVGPASSSTSALSRFGVAPVSRTAPVLFSQEEGAPAEDDDDAAAPEQPEASSETYTDIDTAAPEEPAQEVPEDPAVTTLKEAIANAESDLKGKKSTLDRIQEDAEKYTKSGYARRVAQVEDMKRIRMVRLFCFGGGGDGSSCCVDARPIVFQYTHTCTHTLSHSLSLSP